jgi:hypothetical protein
MRKKRSNFCSASCSFVRFLHSPKMQSTPFQRPIQARVSAGTSEPFLCCSGNGQVWRVPWNISVRMAAASSRTDAAFRSSTIIPASSCGV